MQLGWRGFAQSCHKLSILNIVDRTICFSTTPGNQPASHLHWQCPKWFPYFTITNQLKVVGVDVVFCPLDLVPSRSLDLLVYLYHRRSIDFCVAGGKLKTICCVRTGPTIAFHIITIIVMNKSQITGTVGRASVTGAGFAIAKLQKQSRTRRGQIWQTTMWLWLCLRNNLWLAHTHSLLEYARWWVEKMSIRCQSKT